MRREEFRINGEQISPRIHEPDYIGESRQLAGLKELNANISGELNGFVKQFVSDDYGIDSLKAIVDHVSVFYSIYLRAVLSHEDYHFTTRPPDSVPDVIPNDEDRRGYLPQLGGWTMYGEQQIPYHSEENGEEGNYVSHDVPFEVFFDHYKTFRTESGEEDWRVLRDAGYGELQAWMFWRYFSNRPLNINAWSEDFLHIAPTNKRRDDEEEIQHGKRVWNKYGGDYFHQFDGINLSQPRKNLPCAFPLGCIQNIPGIPNANRLSWEHEHSRPKAWGGKDGRDSQVMCTHHNKIKSDNFLFDVSTLTNIIMIHRLRDFFLDLI